MPGPKPFLTKIWEIKPGVLYLKLELIRNQMVFSISELEERQIDFIWHYKTGDVRLPTYSNHKEILK